MSEKVDINFLDQDNQDITDEPVMKQADEKDQNQEAEKTSNNIEELTKKLEDAEKRADDYYDRLLRASAEFENYKKRISREMRDTIKYANEQIIKEMLVIVDNLERAIDAVPAAEKEGNPLLQGVHLTLNELLKQLEGHAVIPIQSLGEVFDPTFHQAMLQEEVDDKPPNTVIREMQKGYMIHDRLLRPALVGVSKASKNRTDISDSQ
jgi:molecular chaperone GrpE